MKQTKTLKQIALMLFFILCVGTRLQAQFITTWQTTTANEQITIPTTGAGYNYNVNWGDATTSVAQTGDALHSYTTAGTYTVTITGTFPRFYMGFLNPNAVKLRTIAQWGNNAWTSMNAAFANCTNLTYTATDAPNLSGVTDMSNMFIDCTVFNGDISNWNTTTITNMSGMFNAARAFNQNIGSWITTNVTDMNTMFLGAFAFNQNIDGWNTTNVINMGGMFIATTVFNQSLSTWTTTNVTNMSNMFNNAAAFNQSLATWNLSNVTTMVNMLSGSGLSFTNYDATLIGWAAQTRNNITLGAINLKYCAGATARTTLTTAPRNWTITGDAPLLSMNNTTATNATVGTVYTLNASATGNTSALTYSVSPALPAGLSLNTSTGAITGTPTTATTSATYTVTAGQTGCGITQGYTFAVVCPTISFTNTTATNGTVGTAYTLNAAATGLSSLVYSVSPALPVGLALNTSTGAITGTPTTTITSATYTVTAAQGGCSNTQGYTFAVVCPAIVFTNTTATTATIGTAYSLSAAATGLSSLVYSVSPALPVGLALNTSTGAISGTPTAAVASATYTVTASQGGCSNTQGYTFAVVCPAIVFTNTTATVATIGASYTLNAVATGLSSLVYSVSPLLPAGLSLNTSTGVISGTPTTATASATYTVTASQNGCSNTQGYTFAVVCPAIVFTNTTATVATIGVAYTFNAGASNASVYSVLPILPVGLSLNTSTGVISGTPTTITASATYTVTAMQGACSNTQGYTFAVTNCTSVVLNPNLLALPNATLGTPYSLTITATGGGALGTTYTFTTPTPMPAGLSFVNGTISGTPRFSTSVTFLVTATTPSNCNGSRSYTLVILPDPTTAMDTSLSSLIKVYPNPSNGIFNVDFGGINLGKSSVRVYDAQGKSVYSSELNSNESIISLENMSSGIYLMEINTIKGRILKRLVKE